MSRNSPMAGGVTQKELSFACMKTTLQKMNQDVRRQAVSLLLDL